MTTAKASDPLVIAPARIMTMDISIIGVAPYVQNKFSNKAAEQMLQAQMAGSQAKKGKQREARDPEAEFEAAKHIMLDGSYGIPAPAFRSAMISACRLVGFQMTKAKLSVFVEPDGFDTDDGTPLVRLIGNPELHKGHVRLESGVASIAIRPMWREWSATVRIRFDLDQFSAQDVVNLMSRAGQQVGIGEGRPDSKKSHGMGWGLFKIATEDGK